MFLKTEQFEYNGVSVTLSELSALQRIEHLALLKRRAEQAESSGNLQVSVEDLVRTGAFLVEMSLWHNHPQKTASPSMNEAVMQIEQEVLTTWPADAIARAEDVVLRLSGMSGPVHVDTDITEVAKNNALTDDDFSAGKSSTAS
ncbi:phage minor tail protein G [Escherichia coli]|nr:phage minor tail protein G [Escherichia coli]